MSDTAGKVEYFALNLLKRIALRGLFFVVVHDDLFNIVLCHVLSRLVSVDSQGQNVILNIA
jgi:hypothetical protein